MCLALVFVALAANDVPPELVSVARAMRNVTTLETSLVQEKEIAVLADVQKSSGTFAFARPRKLAMDLATTRLVIDGDLMTSQHKALGKVDTVRLSQDPRSRAVADHLFLLLDADPQALGATYRITVVQKTPLVVEMTPLSPALAKIIAQVRATFDTRGFVTDLVLQEVSGDKTRWRFGEPKVNAPIPDAVFAKPTAKKP